MHESGLIDQIVIFDYFDYDGFYWHLVKDHVKLSREIELLSSNMQYFLDKEEVFINGSRTYPRVVSTDLGFRGGPEYPYIVFYIVFRGELRDGVNVYENRYDEEIAEYDYTVSWFLPHNARVLKADFKVPYRVDCDGRVLSFTVFKGTRIGGRELIVFKLK